MGMSSVMGFKGACNMLLEIEHLTYEADHRTILKDINFKVDKGDTIAIIDLPEVERAHFKAT